MLNQDRKNQLKFVAVVILFLMFLGSIFLSVTKGNEMRTQAVATIARQHEELKKISLENQAILKRIETKQDHILAMADANTP